MGHLITYAMVVATELLIKTVKIPKRRFIDATNVAQQCVTSASRKCVDGRIM